MELTEKEIMEVLGQGELYAQAEEIQKKINEAAAVYPNFRFWEKDDDPYGCCVFCFKKFQLKPEQLASIGEILKDWPGSFLYASGYELKIEVNFCQTNKQTTDHEN